jgi:peptidoglycan biosynthesis protein MviN/MurJ (putative lipid II flippase)
MTAGRHLSMVAGRLAFARGLARVPLAALPLVIVGQYGASAASDCFFLVYAGVVFATNAFAPLFETAVVPFVAEARHSRSEATFVRAVLGRALALGVPVSAAIAVTALVAHATGWPARAGWQDGWLFLLLLSAIPALNALASVFSGYLNAEEWYLTVAWAAALRGLTALAVGLAGSRRLPLTSYAAGLVLGELAALVSLAVAPPSRRVFASRAASGDQLREFWRLFLSMSLGGLANSSKGFVDRFVATGVGVGAVSILEFCERLFTMAVSFLGAPFATVVLSRWSAAHPAGGTVSAHGLRAEIRRAQMLAAAAGAVIFVGGAVLALSPYFEWLYDRFAVVDRPMARFALLCYVLGAVPYLLSLVTTQAVFVVRDASFVAKIAVVVAALNVPLDYLGLWTIGLPGIALGSSVLHLVGWVAASRRLRAHASRVPLPDGIPQ